MSPRALEILSVVSGALLTSVQRRCLVPMLDELLTDPTQAPIGAGPLSQADVLGASLALAAFSLKFAPSRWTFVHIPAGRSKSPDIYAIADSGHVWFLELKAVAPLDSDVRTGAVLDTCARVSAQRSRAVTQLRGVRRPPRAGPAVRVAVQGSVARAITSDARAFVIVILPRAGLASRPDIRGPGVRGCPPGGTKGNGVACIRDCLDGTYANSVTSPVALFGKDDARFPSASNGAAILGALRVINGALWAGATPLVDEALARFVMLARHVPETERGALAPIAYRYLRASRLATEHTTRSGLASIVEAGVGPVLTEVEEPATTEPRDSGGRPDVTSGRDDDSDWLQREILRGAIEVAGPLVVEPTVLLEATVDRSAETIATVIDGVRLVGTRSRWGIRLVIDTDHVSTEAAVTVQRFLQTTHEGLRATPIEIGLEENLHAIPKLRRRVEAAQQLGVSLDSPDWSGWLSSEGLLELRRSR